MQMVFVLSVGVGECNRRGHTAFCVAHNFRFGQQFRWMLCCADVTTPTEEKKPLPAADTIRTVPMGQKKKKKRQPISHSGMLTTTPSDHTHTHATHTLAQTHWH